MTFKDLCTVGDLKNFTLEIVCTCNDSTCDVGYETEEILIRVQIGSREIWEPTDSCELSIWNDKKLVRFYWRACEDYFLGGFFCGWVVVGLKSRRLIVIYYLGCVLHRRSQYFIVLTLIHANRSLIYLKTWLYIGYLKINWIDVHSGF